MKVSLCSAFDKPKDGISDYSGYLSAGLKKYVDLIYVGLDSYIADSDYYAGKAKEANNADICHVQFNYLYFNGSMLYNNRFFTFAKYLKVPLVMTIHEIGIEAKPLPLHITSRIKRELFNRTLFFWNRLSLNNHKRMYNLSDRVLAHTRQQADLIIGLIGHKDKVAVMPHGIPYVSDGDKCLPSDEAKSKFGINGKFVLTIFGFINNRKDYGTALDSLRELPDNVVLLIAGGRMTDKYDNLGYYDNLFKKISASQLGDRVKITGYLGLEDIPLVMAATDICLAPFKSVNGSGALSLYIGYNKPIIASDIDSHQEINSRINCLELFRHEDYKDLLDKINRLMTDAGRIAKLIAGVKEYTNEFSYDKVAARTVELYNEVISKRRV
ncbi:MAG: glycosyltransferase family 4 protein [Candidatus Omnitrophota bacterium]|nr:glycosyltransferase family 4 protein [Candidatus Omnitrophota bacterium]MBU2035449.1 glycosyltransferase family 4 protein [Candidatus Omnitrophota bacterium]MBU2221627.1 glycosyltransferase family 4 protein [Candidatus Omnitrophota bacterium]MBU2257872.1 glycosyltransferase family 4 protein [Candidatus Omnitrophota bacterium]